MAGKISIFDIPHIMTGVASHLSRGDQANCNLVSQTFHGHFRRILWRELLFAEDVSPEQQQLELELDPTQDHDDHPTKDTTTTSSSSFSVTDNCQWTKTLTISSHCRRSRLLPLLPHFKRLEILKSYLIRSATTDDDEDPFFTEVLNLARNNLDLRCWSMCLEGNLPTPLLYQLTGIIASKSRLTVLELGIKVMPCRGWIRCVLQSLPTTLRGLYLNWKFMENKDSVDSFPDLTWPESYPTLEVVDFALRMADDDVGTLLNFLDRCPALSELGIPTLMSESAMSRAVSFLELKNKLPCLTTLDLGLFMTMREHDWSRLLRARKGRISGFATCIPFNTSTTRLYLREMISQWADTLHTLIIGLPLTVNSKDLHLILTKFPKLKRVDCLVGRIVDPTVYGWEPTILGENGFYAGADWACLEVEEFKMMFADGRRKDAVEPVLSLQEEWTINVIQYAYRQVGRLTKLRDLAIGWWTKTDYIGAECAHLDMSLASGLDQMAGLKSLKTLDITHARVLNVGMSEMEWMAENWPQLKSISGLLSRFPLVELPSPDTRCIAWVRPGNTDLMIQ
ncbi:hypothetical protein B0O80DRAFT_495508 [Mortierella sp. GBAus27b]|nr:hypothetical protein BGX31_008594 [Mortierella sp. GBA43]KAI8358849.1 hypothetical protein B0O80DRAFT_495508 [Mortierella sp. GBAus27b]